MATVFGPDFLCIGTQKEAIRWLYREFERQPGFWMPPIKSLHYFDRHRRQPGAADRLHRRAKRELDALNGQRVARGRRPLDRPDVKFLRAYRTLRPWRIDFDGYGELFRFKSGLISGDMTSDYMRLPAPVVAEICSRFPDIKVVFIARDPIDRIGAHLSRQVERGDLLFRSVNRAMVETLIARDYTHQQSDVVRRWRRVIGDRLGVFLFDDLIEDAASFRDRIVSFLGAAPAEGVEPVFEGETGARLTMPASIEEALVEGLAAEVSLCAAEFGGAASRWPERHGRRNDGLFAKGPARPAEAGAGR